MIMITGGAFQGKRGFVSSRFGLNEADMLDAGSADIGKLMTARCVYNFELAVKRIIEQGGDPVDFARRCDIGIVIINEIGCGIIPLDRSEREWRELTGRAGCVIAERSDAVYRLCCGIPVKIKGNDT